MRSEMVTLIDKLTIANIPFEVTDDAMKNKNNQTLIWAFIAIVLFTIGIIRLF